MTFKQWGMATIFSLSMNTPLTVGSYGMDLAVTIVTGLGIVLLFVRLVDRSGKDG